MKHPAKVHTKQQQTHLDIKHRYSWPLDMCKGTYKSIYTQTLRETRKKTFSTLSRDENVKRHENEHETSKKKLISYDFSTKMWFDRNFPESFALFSFSPHFFPHKSFTGSFTLELASWAHTFPLCWESGWCFLCVREEVLKSKTQKLAYVCCLWESARWVIAENF